MPETALEVRLAAARTRLILDQPFLGALVLHLPPRPAAPSWCPTTSTDARAFYYNPDYLAALSLAQIQYCLAQAALRCALGHLARRGQRERRRWELACDLAIHPLLLDAGLSPPPEAEAALSRLFVGLSAEEIYPLLDETESDEAQTEEAEGQGGRAGERETGGAEAGAEPAGQGRAAGAADGVAPEGAAMALAPPPEPGPEARERLARQWRERLAGAAQQAQGAGRLGGELARLVDHLLRPALPWRELLAHHLSRLGRDDYSYQRPARREGDFILPALRGERVELVVGLDTSGSIREQELAAFIAELDALKGQVRARLSVLPCDAELSPEAPLQCEPWERTPWPARLGGGGGTRFTPVFDWVERWGPRPDLLLYFTDARGDFPARAPDYPVLWLVKGGAEVPWGERIQLN
ncbi:MAG: hypothetical protein JXM75_07860 [Chromatiaceae bacterium]|nr:hypothetical protein [Chromatiaceae bacterium]